MRGLRGLFAVFLIAAATGFASTANAVPFQPVMDEFWVVRNDVENFRDSFSDGVLPPSGPEDAITPIGVTYRTSGAAGFTSETGGKLTMTPSLGSPTLITGATADTFVGAQRFRARNPTNSAFLGSGQSFEIHGLFDLSTLPTVTGQGFGIRANDRSPTSGGKDVFHLGVSKSGTTGDIIVRSAELDFVADSAERVGFTSIQSFLADAVQIELIISKQAGSDLVDASFILYDLNATAIHSGTIDNVNDVTGLPAQIFTDVNFTRPQLYALDTGIPIPEPGTLAIFAFGLAGLGFMRRRAA